MVGLHPPQEEHAMYQVSRSLFVVVVATVRLVSMFVALRYHGQLRNSGNEAK